MSIPSGVGGGGGGSGEGGGGGGGGGGCCKSVVWSIGLALGESVHSSCVCLKFVMPNAFNV